MKEDVIEVLKGYTYEDMEPIFEEVIIPLYLFSSQTPSRDPNYKIIDRETGEEYTVEKAIEVLKEQGIIPK